MLHCTINRSAFSVQWGLLLFLVLLTFLNSCEEESKGHMASSSCVQLATGSHLPRFFTSGEKVGLSFVQRVNDSLSSTGLTWIIDGKPSQPELDDARANMFINWADYPSVAFYSDGKGNVRKFNHWLQYSGEGTYDYDIFYKDEQPDQQRPALGQKLHQDTISAEHGFVSSAALPLGGLQVTWLDGRFTKQNSGGDAGTNDVELRDAKNVEEATDDHGHGGGAMTLRTKVLGSTGSIELDHRVCDCCNTATIATDSLVMVAYRDRSDQEIRDIAYVIKHPIGDEWSSPKLVHADNWEISGCPVNGPALAAFGPQNIAIVWYTAPRDRAQILFSRYNADLDAFAPPTLLDDNAPLGRVAIQLDKNGTAYVSALTKGDTPDESHLMLWTIPAPKHKPGQAAGHIKREVLAKTKAARSAGFPQIALHDSQLYWARTQAGPTRNDHYVEVCHKELEKE